MNWIVFAIGKPKLGFARAGVEEYAGRLRGFAPVKVEFLKASTRETESTRLLQRSEGMFRVVLDERGEEVSSLGFVEKIRAWERDVKTVALLIGGAEGHTETLRRAADWKWSLGKLTLQHELALVVLCEQLYRAYTIKAGLPYHRE